MFDTYESIFSQRADSYQAAMARWPDVRCAEFEMVLAPLPLEAGTTLCDMPAGGGYLRRYLARDVDYVAVEASAHFFARCPTEAGARRFQCSADAVPLQGASVDYIVSLAGLHHVSDLDAVFVEMRRLACPGGWVVIADVDIGSASDRFLNGFVHAHNPMGHTGVFLDESTPNRLARAGLRVIDDRRVAVPWSFDSADEMGAYCRLLFGVERASARQVTDHLAAAFESCGGPGAVNIAWPLRRLVCRPA